MTVELAGLLAMLAFFGVGHGALLLVSRFRGWPERGRLEWLVTATMFGTALVSSAVYGLIWLVGPLSVGLGAAITWTLAVVGVLALVQVALPRGPRALAFRAPRPRSAEPRRVLDHVLLGACVVFALLAAVLSAAWPVHLFDPVFHFAYKGKVLFHEGLATDAFTSVDHVVGRVMTHPSYPPLVPTVEVFASWPLGEFSAHAARIFCALFVVAPAVWIAAALEDRGRRAQLVGALLWLSLPVLFYFRLPHNDMDKALSALLVGPELTRSWFGSGGLRRVDGVTLDMGGDLPVAAFLCGAMVYLARPRRTGGDGWIAGVLLGGAVLAKNEGLALAAVLVVACVLCWGVRRLTGAAGAPCWRAVGLALGCAVALAAAYLAFKRQIPVIDESYPELLKPGPLKEALLRDRTYRGQQESPLVTVGREYGATFLTPLRWNLLWPLFLAVLGACLVRPGRALARGALLPALVTAGALVLFFLILCVTPWHLGSLFNTGIPDRLFLQVAPLAAWAVAAWTLPPRDSALTASEPEVKP